MNAIDAIPFDEVVTFNDHGAPTLAADRNDALQQLTDEARAAYRALIVALVENKQQADPQRVREVLGLCGCSLEKLERDVSRARARHDAMADLQRADDLENDRRAASDEYAATRKEADEAIKVLQRQIWAHEIACTKALDKTRDLQAQQQKLRAPATRTLQTTADPAVDRRLMEIGQEITQHTITVNHMLQIVRTKQPELKGQAKSLADSIRSLGARLVGLATGTGQGIQEKIEAEQRKLAKTERELRQIEMAEQAAKAGSEALAKLRTEEARLLESKRDWRAFKLD